MNEPSENLVKRETEGTENVQTEGKEKGPDERTKETLDEGTKKGLNEGDHEVEDKGGKVEVSLDEGDNAPKAKRRKKEYVRPEPTADRCQFFVERKRRYCKAPPRKDYLYCVEHSYELKDETIKKRIPCPLDPKHSIYEDSLNRHLKKCNARPGLRPCFYEENINAGDSEGFDIKQKVSVRNVSEEKVMNMVERVKLLYAEHVKNIRQEFAFHPVLKSMAEDPMMGQVAQKHIQQQASLVGNMESLGLLEHNHCYVEFGAGKGGLSHWVQLSTKDKPDNKFILIDKSSCRYKMDTYHRGEEQGPCFERVKIDIQHLNLGKMPQIEQCSKPIVGIGKHLCGGATDLMLRCIIESFPKCTTDQKVLGIMLALCCHHRCDWKSYVGKKFMKACGVSPHDFLLLCSMTSWATCNSPHVTEEKGEGVENDTENAHSNEEKNRYSHPKYGSLLPQDREKIGYWCKNLIDYGRVCYLRDNGFDIADLIAYVDQAYTIENTALMAKVGKCAVTEDGEL